MGNSTIADRLADVHPQMLRVEGETDPQLLGKAIGRAIDQALRRCHLTNKEAAFRMRYTDSAVVGRWIAYTETPQLARLRMLGDTFWCELLIALAEGVPGIEKQTQLVMRRPA
jgi:hypothetical protein